MKFKALGLALAGSAVAVALVGGATFALFTASTGNSQNDFTAAKTCLSSYRDNGDVVPGPMFYVTAAQGATPPPASTPGSFPTGYWVPGDTNTRKLNVQNGNPPNTPVDNSCINLWLTGVSATATGDAMLADKLNVTIKANHPLQGYVTVASGTLTQFLTGNMPLAWPAAYPVMGSQFVALPNSSIQDLQFTVNFDSSADNTYQGKNLVVAFTVSAVQQTHNPTPTP